MARTPPSRSPRMLLAAAVAAAAAVSCCASLAAARDPITCGLVVPADVTKTAQGLATPFYLKSVAGGGANCTMGEQLHQAFVNAVILDTVNDVLYSYTPLVSDFGKPVATAPTVPVLPSSFLIAIFIASNFNAFGIAGDTLQLLNADNTTSLVDGNCVTGVVRGDKIDSFNQFSTCNSVKFFAKANQLIADGKLKVPQLGNGTDGLPCPSVRSFDLVDSTQSDTVPSSYILLANNGTVQNTAANLVKYPTDNGDNQVILNESDAALLDQINTALGCSSWKIQDLTDSTGPLVSNFATDELQASIYQKYPVALVPAADPDVISNIGGAEESLLKLNTYRAVVGQAPVSQLSDADTYFYCMALLSVGTKRLVTSKSLMEKYPTPDNTTGSNLYTFWAARFAVTYADADDGLDCVPITNIANPVSCDADRCTVANVTFVDALGVYTANSTTATPSSGAASANATIIGLSVALAVVVVGAVGLLAYAYHRTFAFSNLGGQGIALRGV